MHATTNPVTIDPPVALGALLAQVARERGRPVASVAVDLCYHAFFEQYVARCSAAISSRSCCVRARRPDADPHLRPARRPTAGGCPGARPGHGDVIVSDRARPTVRRTP
jgi:hypothetical protein